MQFYKHFKTRLNLNKRHLPHHFIAFDAAFTIFTSLLSIVQRLRRMWHLLYLFIYFSIGRILRYMYCFFINLWYLWFSLFCKRFYMAFFFFNSSFGTPMFYKLSVIKFFSLFGMWGCGAVGRNEYNYFFSSN